jgi:hypothetical protein
MSAGVVQPGRNEKRNVVALSEMAAASRLAQQAKEAPKAPTKVDLP